MIFTLALACEDAAQLSGVDGGPNFDAAPRDLGSLPSDAAWPDAAPALDDAAASQDAEPTDAGISDTGPEPDAGSKLDAGPGACPDGINQLQARDENCNLGGRFVAYEYTPQLSFTLDRIEVPTGLSRWNLPAPPPVAPPDIVPGQLLAEIRADSNGLPSSVALTSGLISIAPGYQWQSVPLSPPVALVAGTRYWVVVKAPEADCWLALTGVQVHYTSSDAPDGPWSQPGFENFWQFNFCGRP